MLLLVELRLSKDLAADLVVVLLEVIKSVDLLAALLRRHGARVDAVAPRRVGVARLYVMQFLDLSRSKYGRLYHTMFDYNMESDDYSKIQLWANPYDSKEKIFAPTLAPRSQVEKGFA